MCKFTHSLQTPFNSNRYGGGLSQFNGVVHSLVERLNPDVERGKHGRADGKAVIAIALVEDAFDLKTPLGCLLDIQRSRHKLAPPLTGAKVDGILIN